MERKPDWLPGFPVQIYCNRSIIKAVDKAGISIGPARFLGNFNDDRIGFHINPCS